MITIFASTLTTNLAILVLAGFIGFVVISKVPNTLHTPLMSGTNAIHGIVLLGGLLIVGFSGGGTFNKFILVIAIAFGTINVVGGFLVTDRMLEMFKSKPRAATSGDLPGSPTGGAHAGSSQSGSSQSGPLQSGSSQSGLSEKGSSGAEPRDPGRAGG
jgi:H+-translocating NAD(P) transhydrogenase subunit alpha